MTPIYIFSGLGADKSVFQRLDFSGFDVTFIEWIPTVKNESIENYAIRLLSQIKSVKPILIGLSFGGLIAIEVAKQIKTEKIILISSAKTKYEIPIYFRLFGALGIHKLLPTALLKKTNFLTNWFFGVKEPMDRLILKNVLRNTDSQFLKWAIDKIVHWQNTQAPENTFHIHGSSDKILQFRFVASNFKIKNGGHLMVLNRHEAVSKILREILFSISQ